MIKVTVQLIPGGIGAAKKTWTAEISNDVMTTVQTGGRKGAYVYKLFDAGGRIFREGRIANFPRKERGAWDLLFRVLLNAVGSRNGDWTREETK